MDYRASVYFDHLWLGMIGAARNRILVGLQFVCNSVYRPLCYFAVCDRVAEVGSLLAGAKMAIKTFVNYFFRDKCIVCARNYKFANLIQC